MSERKNLPIVTDEQVINDALKLLIEQIKTEALRPNRIKIFRNHWSLFTIPTEGEYGTFYGTRRLSISRVEKHHLRNLGCVLMNTEYGLDISYPVKIVDKETDFGVLIETNTFYSSNIQGMSFVSREDFYHGEKPATRITWSVWDTAPHLRFHGFELG